MMDIFGQIYGYAYKSICNITTGWPFKLSSGAVLLIVARHAAPQPAYITASPYQALAGYSLCHCTTGTGTGTGTVTP